MKLDLFAYITYILSNTHTRARGSTNIKFQSFFFSHQQIILISKRDWYQSNEQAQSVFKNEKKKKTRYQKFQVQMIVIRIRWFYFCWFQERKKKKIENFVRTKRTRWMTKQDKNRNFWRRQKKIFFIKDSKIMQNHKQ